MKLFKRLAFEVQAEGPVFALQVKVLVFAEHAVKLARDKQAFRELLQSNSVCRDRKCVYICRTLHHDVNDTHRRSLLPLDHHNQLFSRISHITRISNVFAHIQSHDRA